MDKKREVTVKIDNLTIIRILFLIFMAVIGFLVLKKIIEPLVLVVISAFLAIALNPAVSWISRKLRLRSRATATGIAYILVVGFLVTFFSLVFPPIVNQTIDFVKQAPQTIKDLRHDNPKVDELIAKYNIEKELSKYTDQFGSNIKQYSSNALSTAGKVGMTLAKTVIVFVLTFMMLVEGPAWFERYYATLKPKNRQHQKQLAHKMYKIIVGFVNGQVIVAALGGLFATLGLLVASNILNVSVNAVALGGIVALFALLPLIGTTIGASIVILSSAIVSLPLALIMIGYFIIYQQIENVTIQPYIQSKSSNLTAMTVLISALVGAGMGGLLGALFAIPAAGILKILIEDYFDRKSASKLSS